MQTAHNLSPGVFLLENLESLCDPSLERMVHALALSTDHCVPLICLAHEYLHQCKVPRSIAAVPNAL